MQQLSSQTIDAECQRIVCGFLLILVTDCLTAILCKRSILSLPAIHHIAFAILNGFIFFHKLFFHVHIFSFFFVFHYVGAFSLFRLIVFVRKKGLYFLGKLFALLCAISSASIVHHTHKSNLVNAIEASHALTYAQCLCMKERKCINCLHFIFLLSFFSPAIRLQFTINTAHRHT